MTRVLLVDDHAFVRAQIADLLAGVDGIEVVGECADGIEVLTAVAAVTPDVVLMDVRMPIKSGIDATRELLEVDPTMRVLIVTGSPSQGIVHQAHHVGAAGLLLKGGDPQQLIAAVRAVASGGTAWSIEPAVTQHPAR